MGIGVSKTAKKATLHGLFHIETASTVPARDLWLGLPVALRYGTAIVQQTAVADDTIRIRPHLQ